MPYNAKSSTVKIGETEMDYVVFGNGEKPFVIIPGLSDGLRTVYRQEKTLARYFKRFTHDFRVYVVSRKRKLEEGCTTRDMARDYYCAMKMLGIADTYVMGVSQGRYDCSIPCHRLSGNDRKARFGGINIKTDRYSAKGCEELDRNGQIKRL